MYRMKPTPRALGLAGVVLSASLGTGVLHAMPGGIFNRLPHFIHGPVSRAEHDGETDDLLTGGLGRSGLAGGAPPVSDPPTAAELRRLAIYSNYRALADMTPGGGYGTLYGPNVTSDGEVTDDEGLIAGVEYLAYGSRGKGRENVTLMVQIPAGFDPDRPCIVTGPSSGSRGIYGAIATSGEWGLKRGCAVAYTDKGTGTGAHNLHDDTVSLITGERVDADAAGKDSHFTARLPDHEREAYNAATPHRFAFKHAHSQLNPEQDWGRFVLWSVEFAFYALNQEYGEAHRNGKIQRRFTPGNTLVIASSVSNGGGASLRAAEQDRRGLIDAVVVSEPNVNPVFDPGFAIVQGDGELLSEHSRSLFDYTTLVNVYQGCASVAAENLAAPLNLAPSADRCASLRDKGLLQSDSPEEQAAEAQAIINAFGILAEQNVVQPSHWFANVPQSIAVTYANSYARASVIDDLCGYSLGATAADNTPAPLPLAAEAVLFGVSNGIPPTGGVNLINNDSAEGPLLDRASISASTGRPDQNLDGALCLRALATGVDPVTGTPLTGRVRAFHQRIKGSIAKLRASGDLDGRPALIVTGRSDAILPPNHSSRPYYGLNQQVEGANSALRYIEITNAQHLDAFNAFPGFDTRFVPLHHYFIQALDRMWAHLTEGESLPPSQVVHTTPRADTTQMIDPAIHLPAIAASPAPEDEIIFDGSELFIPE